MSNVLSDIADMTPEERYQAEADLLEEVAREINAGNNPTGRNQMKTLAQHIERTEAAAEAANIRIGQWVAQFKQQIKAAAGHPENLRTRGLVDAFVYTRPDWMRDTESAV